MNLCNDDESVEEEHAKNKKINCSIKADQNDAKNRQREEAAKYRIQTELESYPATLFNILAESPQWFIECMTKRLRHNEDVRSPQRKKIIKRRGKRDRDSISSPIKQQQQLKEEAEDEEGMMKKRQKELVLHIIGASSDSELWGWNGQSKNDKEKRQQQHCTEDEGGNNKTCQMQSMHTLKHVQT